MSPDAPELHTRDHLANERTFLAYLRTSLSLLSLGISVNRFSLYLLEKNVMPRGTGVSQTLVGAEQLGIGMVVIGLILLIWGTFRYGQVARQIQEEDYKPNLKSMWVLSGIVFVAALFGTYLLFTR